MTAREGHLEGHGAKHEHGKRQGGREQADVAPTFYRFAFPVEPLTIRGDNRIRKKIGDELGTGRTLSSVQTTSCPYRRWNSSGLRL
jgi:hypothetical protein